MKKLLILCISLGVYISSCSKEPEIIPVKEQQPAAIKISPSIQTVQLPENWEKRYYKGELIAYEKKNGMNLFLGDIIIANNELSDNPQKMSDKIMGTGVVESN